MITADNNVFPNNVMTLIKARLAMIDTDIRIFGRPLRNSDPTQSIGVMGVLWLPNEGSYELRGDGIHTPSLDSYLITVQAFVLDADEENGLNTHGVLAETIRSILDRDASFHVALGLLSTTRNGVKKSTKRSGVRQQRYMSNELNGSFLYLSTLEFWLETESINV